VKLKHRRCNREPETQEAHSASIRKREVMFIVGVEIAAVSCSLPAVQKGSACQGVTKAIVAQDQTPA
jgi:hypothetical protein